MLAFAAASPGVDGLLFDADDEIREHVAREKLAVQAADQSKSTGATSCGRVDSTCVDVTQWEEKKSPSSVQEAQVFSSLKISFSIVTSMAAQARLLQAATAAPPASSCSSSSPSLASKAAGQGGRKKKVFSESLGLAHLLSLASEVGMTQDQRNRSKVEKNRQKQQFQKAKKGEAATAKSAASKVCT